MRAYPRIIAHRCGGALAPENSLAGLAVAARLGCRGVEFDVMLTADRVPILMHDATLARTTRCSGRVAARSFAEIRACDPQVPSLAEAIAACSRLGLWTNIELKPTTGHEEETGALVGHWLAAHWDGKGVISSFSEKSALAARRHLPAAPFALLFKRLPADWQIRRERLGGIAVHLAARSATPAQAQALRDAGIHWAAYTVNDRGTADRLFALGATAIFSDRPDLWSPAEMSSGLTWNFTL